MKPRALRDEDGRAIPSLVEIAGRLRALRDKADANSAVPEDVFGELDVLCWDLDALLGRDSKEDDR